MHGYTGYIWIRRCSAIYFLLIHVFFVKLCTCSLGSKVLNEKYKLSLRSCLFSEALKCF